MNRVVHGKVDGCNHAYAADLLLAAELRGLDSVPFFGIGGTHVAADLHVVEGEIGLIEIGSHGVYELAKTGFKLRRSFWISVGFALIPEDSLDTSAGCAKAAEHGAVE